jgi:hypothetical protein
VVAHERTGGKADDQQPQRSFLGQGLASAATIAFARGLQDGLNLLCEVQLQYGAADRVQPPVKVLRHAGLRAVASRKARMGIRVFFRC